MKPARAMRTGMMRMGAGIGQASTFLPVKTRGSELGPVFLLRCCCQNRTHSNVPKSALTFHWRRHVASSEQHGERRRRRHAVTPVAQLPK